MSNQALCGESSVPYKLTELAALDGYGSPRFDRNDALQYEDNVFQRLRQIKNHLDHVDERASTAPAADMRRLLQDAANELAVIYSTHQAMLRVYDGSSLAIDDRLLDYAASLITKAQFLLLKIL